MEAEEHSLIGIPSDSGVPEDVLGKHGVRVDDDRVLGLRGVEAAVEQRDEVLGHVAVPALAALGLLALLVVAGQQVVHRKIHVQVCALSHSSIHFYTGSMIIPQKQHFI